MDMKQANDKDFTRNDQMNNEQRTKNEKQKDVMMSLKDPYEEEDMKGGVSLLEIKSRRMNENRNLH